MTEDRRQTTDDRCPFFLLYALCFFLLKRKAKSCGTKAMISSMRIKKKKSMY